MNQFFIQIGLAKQYFRERISNMFKKSFNHNIKIYFLEDDRVININKKYILCKIPLIKKLFNKYGDFYCIIQNNNGICKTIIKDTSIIDIIKIKNNFNKDDKTDNLYLTKMIQDVKIVGDNYEYDCTNNIINIDKQLNLTFEQVLKINKIYYDNTCKIIISYSDTLEFTYFIIEDNLENYLLNYINNFI